MTTQIRTAADRLFSDAHKDAYGFRPSQRDWQRWAVMSDVELDAEEDRLYAAVGASIEEDARQHAAAAVKFEATVAELIASGAGDRETAIRWLMDVHRCDGDRGFLEYELGLKYEYLGPRWPE